MSKYQRICITLTDGRETFWCGNVQLNADDPDIKIAKMEISEPMDTSDLVSFGPSGSIKLLPADPAPARGKK